MDTDSKKLVPIFDDETEVTVRILPDRAVADFFVQGGRWAATQGWPGPESRKASDSSVMLWSSISGVGAQVEVYGMWAVVGSTRLSWTTQPYLTIPEMLLSKSVEA
eukprot:COSAG06_NODE_3394_length_5407_cov_3.531462_4_plen_106_part_00